MCFGILHVHSFSRHGDSLNLCSLRRRGLLRIAFSSPHLLDPHCPIYLVQISKCENVNAWIFWAEEKDVVLIRMMFTRGRSSFRIII